MYKELLLKYSSIFVKSKTDLGRTELIEHHIETGDEQPFNISRCAYIRLNSRK